MSESCRENLPLLCDDYSDEDFRIRKSSPKFQHLFRHSVSSGRARSQAIGAAAIITRWPEHFSSLLKYWWIAFGMIAFTFFVIYNSIVAISMLPDTHHKPFKYHDKEYISKNMSRNTSKFNVFMHIFVNNYEESNIKYYLPYIVKFSKKYSDLKHNVIVVLKDEPNDKLDTQSDEMNIEMAWNTLWMADKKEEIINLSENTNIQIISLIEYMDDSPLKKYWRHLPQKFYGFLARCIAIWDKGGVAFDPVILTPSSPNPGHRESLENILNNFKSINLEKPTDENILMPKKKINNIQDIIENIEYQDKNIMQENLLEAETKVDSFKTKNTNINKIKRSTNINSRKRYLNIFNKQNKTKVFKDSVYMNKIDKKSEILSEESGLNHLSTSKKVVNGPDDEITTKHNLFPMFLEYLFNNPRNISEYSNKHHNTLSAMSASTSSESLTITNSTLKNVFSKNQQSHSKTKGFSKRKEFTKKNVNIDKNFLENEHNISLSINLKGNLIATETPCHAFIGTIFSNAPQHSDDESITDFIITELLIFCKGVLSSCKGVDVILI
ncbi:unnamed protein product [Euphydryas editha]|uniref:Uncharacterized protein n=1 Tax=Euphydryas editha TaxID=104508 RepID=A0AAU9V2Z1_EUPED|nr:unnamed protein product [Euphydryas editha]